MDIDFKRGRGIILMRYGENWVGVFFFIDIFIVIDIKNVFCIILDMICNNFFIYLFKFIFLFIVVLFI